MKKIIMAAVLLGGMLTGCNGGEQTNTTENMNTTLQLTQEWDKVFPLSEKVNHRKVTFNTQYGLTLAADLYTPKDAQGKLAAIAVSGPFGATKEQSSGLYAMQMAERGFVALAFDPSYTGESSGEPRRTASPDINTEDFMAAVDFLSKQDNVDADKIGIIGICGWGGIALNAAAADTRIKATVASTMYDMTRVSGNGYNDSEDKEESRHAARETLSKQRLADPMAMAGGVIDPLPDEAPQFVKDYFDYYKTPRGY
ncbi:MAG: alpha/beta hydrolase, partial [Muribaculaceae bacterium]|nr:alpha/beta hydrolase [Muribaculaceae bacterium]